MKPARKLQLRKESLSELATYELRAMVGGSAAASAVRAMTCCATCDPVAEVTRIVSPLVQTSGGTDDMDCTTKGCAEIAVTR